MSHFDEIFNESQKPNCHSVGIAPSGKPFDLDNWIKANYMNWQAYKFGMRNLRNPIYVSNCWIYDLKVLPNQGELYTLQMTLGEITPPLGAQLVGYELRIGTRHKLLRLKTMSEVFKPEKEKEETLSDVVHRLGGRIMEGGINWTWAERFPTEVKAEEFVTWLEHNGYEDRGVYPPSAGEKGYSVRYREN